MTYFGVEPTEKCPECGEICHAEWVDVGFGPYSFQAGPFYCVCGWVEAGCPQNKCLPDRCVSWSYCGGKAILKGKNNNEQE